MDDPNQRKLLEFFEIIENPMWLVQLRDIVKKQGQDIWDIDVKTLAQEYMARISMETDLNLLATAMLVCSILLKYKSKRLGLKELEGYLEEEIEKLDEEPKQETLDLTQLEQTGQVSLDDLTKSLNKMLGKTDRKKYEKKKPEIYIPTTAEDFKTTGLKLLEFFLANTEKNVYEYHELRDQIKLNNNLFMTLLYLNDDEKVKLKQKNFYEPLKVHVKTEKNNATEEISAN